VSACTWFFDRVLLREEGFGRGTACKFVEEHRLLGLQLAENFRKGDPDAALAPRECVRQEVGPPFLHVFIVLKRAVFKDCSEKLVAYNTRWQARRPDLFGSLP
jgi:hypothetical protein